MYLWMIIQAIILGIVEGLTEFIPVSSTGHLIITSHLIQFEGEFANTFNVVIQLGAILAIVVLFWPKISHSLRHLMPGESGFNLWLKIAIASVPAVVVVLLFEDIIDTYLFNPFTVALGLIVGGILVIMVEKKFSHQTIKDIDKISIKQALWIGVYQCLSLWPGMSRSSSTIVGGLITGLTAKTAAEFSFFLAIPAMVGATVFKLGDFAGSMTQQEWVVLGIGFFVSFIVALLVVKVFLEYLNKKPLKPFGIYRIIVGAILLLMIATNIMKI